MLEYPGVGHVDGLGEQGKIVSSEVRRLFPKVTVSVKAGHRDVMAVTLASLVLPNARFDQAETDDVDRLS